MKIAWLAPYPVSVLEDRVDWGVRKQSSHPCSWIMNLSRELARLPDVELHIFTVSPWVTCTQTVDYDGVRVHVVKNGIPFTHRNWPPICPVDVITGFALDSFKIRREVKKLNPDIIHAHGTENSYALAAISMCYPFIISMQGIINEVYKVNRTFRFQRVAGLEKRVLQSADYVSCRTEFDTGFVNSVNPGTHVFQVQEAMNPLFFRQQWQGCKGKCILFVGSMGKHKGLNYLLSAMAVLAKEDQDIKLYIIGGSGGEIEAYRERSQELGIERQVEFKGFLTSEQIIPYHLESRIFVIPSTNENSPNTLAEAMVSGMPCVASAVGGIPSMIDDEKTGLLFSRGDVDQLVFQIERLFKDDALCHRLGNAAAEVARKRHWPEAVAKETMKTYEYILSQET